MACTCPHHVHRNAICKHMAAVENATDDGTLDVFLSKDEDDAEPEDCDGLGGILCWPCVQTGRKELPNEPPLQSFLSMARQVTVSDSTDQRTLTESANAATDDTSETPTALLDRARQHATNVATEHFQDLPVETINWEVSHRTQRQAGVTKYDPLFGTIQSLPIIDEISRNRMNSRGGRQSGNSATFPSAELLMPIIPVRSTTRQFGYATSIVSYTGSDLFVASA